MIKYNRSGIYRTVSIAVICLFSWNQISWTRPSSSSTLRPLATAKAPVEIVSKPEAKEGPPQAAAEDKFLPLITVKDAKAVGRKAAEWVIEVVREIPDAVIIMDPAAGSVCNEIVKICREAKENGKEIDFSRTKFFFTDEYVALPQEHLLSQSLLIARTFSEPLKAIDPARAPKDVYIPYTKKGEKPEEAASRYGEALQQAIRDSGRGKADLAVLSIGGAYLNEVSSTPTDRTRVVRLKPNTFLNLKFRFKNLGFQPNFKKDYVKNPPTQAITLGIANILESYEILLLAAGEEQAPVVKEIYEKPPTPDFPATFLKNHRNIRCIIDQDAGHNLPQVRTPWRLQGIRFEWTKESVMQAVLEILAGNESLTIADVTVDRLEETGVPEDEINRFNFGELSGMEAIRYYARQSLSSHLHSESNDLLPKKGEKVVIFSIHPDDDVITMAAVIKMLVARGCQVTIVYMTSGENAVRDGYGVTRRIYKRLVREFSENNEGRLPDSDKRASLKEEARSRTRRQEAKNAILKLLGPENSKNVTQEFLEMPYYKHIGFVGVRPIGEKEDVDAVRKLLDKINPDYIFYSAEKDPRGTHGLGVEIIARALRRKLLGGITRKTYKAPVMCGCRGAWQEWSLHQPEGLVIVPFGNEQMIAKAGAIDEHKTQLSPMFPGLDPRKFRQRAWDRNRQAGRTLEQLGILEQPGYLSTQTWYAEVFRIFPYKDFLSGFEEDGLVTFTTDGSIYRLTKRPDETFTETLRVGPYMKEIEPEQIKKRVFMQLLTHSNPEIRDYLLKHSKEKIAQYVAGLASSYEQSGDFQGAAEYWAMAVHRYLKEGQNDKAIDGKSNALKNLRLMIKYPQPLQSVKLAESLKKDAELNEAVGYKVYKDIAARRWAIASKQYHDLALKTKLRDEKDYFYEESARGAENAARLDKESGEEELESDKKLERKKHQAKNWHFAALNWLLAKRYIKALRCAKKAIRLDYELGNEIFKAMDLVIAANSCSCLGWFNQAIEYGLSAIELNEQLSKSKELNQAQRIERKIHLVRDLALASHCYFNIEQHEEAIKYGRKALDILEAAQLDKYEVGLEHILLTYKSLAFSHYFLSHYGQAAKYAQKGAGLFLKEWHDERNAGSLLSLAGKNLALLKERSKSAECYEGAAALRENAGESEKASKDWANAAMGRVILAKMGINKMRNYEKAGYDDRRSAELAEAGGRIEKAIRHYLFAEKNFDEAMMLEGKEHCEEKVIETLKVLVSKIWESEPGIVGFRGLLEHLEAEHPDIFGIETERYLQDALRKAEHQLREEAKGDARPLKITDTIKDQRVLSAIAAQA